MRLLTLLLTAAAMAFSQPVVSNISTVGVTHSTVTLKFDTSSVGSKVRVRYGMTTSYEGAGSFPDSGLQHYSFYNTNPSRWVQVRISGLKPNTLYHFCPQVSNDNTTWSTCVDHTATTAAIEAGPHPAYPIPPAPVDTARPDTTGYTVRAVAADCGDLQTKINQAAAAILVNGSVITIPAGTVCTGPFTLKAPAGVKTFTAANVNTVTNRITITSHGFSDNDVVQLGGGGMGSAGFDIFRQHRGFSSGSLYVVRVIDANTISLTDTPGGAAIPFTTSTFTVSGSTITVPNGRFVPVANTAIQFVSTGNLPAPLAQNTTYYAINGDVAGRTFQVSTTSGGSALTLTNAGTGTHSIADQGYGGSLVKYPATNNKIVIRTATPDNEFVPEGVRVTPDFQPKMATLRPAGQAWWQLALNADDLAANYRIEGIEFTHADTATAQNTINPPAFTSLLHMQRATANIIFDRCYIHGLGFPNRLTRAILEFNGYNSAIINSYWEHLDHWTPNREGLGLTRVNNTQFTIAPGTWHFGSGSNSLTSTVTVNLSGSAAGTVTGRVYFSMDGVLTLNLPTGVNASCIGAPCTVTHSAAPAYPVDSSIDATATACKPIGNLTFETSALTAVSGEPLTPDKGHSREWEGASSFIAGSVAGRTGLINNVISSAGLPVHYDHANGNTGPTPADYSIIRNHFITPRSQIANLPESNKLRYAQRQQLEWKNGKRILIRGNIFEGVFTDVTPISAAVAISATPGLNADVSDVEMSYNVFRYGSGTWAVLGGRPDVFTTAGADTGPPPRPLLRTWIHNNLAHDIDAFRYRAMFPGYTGTGVHTDHRYAFEDLRVEHNTLYDFRGNFGRLGFLGVQPHEGLRVADNIFWLNAGSVFVSDECTLNIPACSGDGKALLDTFSFNTEWVGNSVIAGWQDNAGTIARTSKAYITTALPTGTDAYLQSEMAGQIDWLNLSGRNFRIGPLATHRSGGSKRATDGLDRGVNVDALERHVGIIRVKDVLNITGTGATIPFEAPDGGAACRIAYGTGSNPATWTGRSSVDTGQYARAIPLTGLLPGTTYHYRVWCSGTAQSETRVFRTVH
jgi:hypothetical protein